MADCIRKMVKHEGALSFYKGILPPILAETPKRATKFFSFECFNSLLKSSGATGPMVLVLAGLGAGLTEAIVITPFERVKVHLQAQRNKLSEQPSSWSCARDIARRDGFGTRGLYKGLTATLGRHGVWNAVYFGCYHNLKSLLTPSQSASVSTSLLLGFLSGAFASVTNIPFDVAKSRIQGPQPVDNPFKYSTTTATLRIIVKEEGYQALFKGLVPKVLRLGPGGGIMFVVYEEMSSLLKRNGL
eukprot:Em0014g571a